jgi:hypothetical protein
MSKLSRNPFVLNMDYQNLIHGLRFRAQYIELRYQTSVELTTYMDSRLAQSALSGYPILSMSPPRWDKRTSGP